MLAVNTVRRRVRGARRPLWPRPPAHERRRTGRSSGRTPVYAVRLSRSRDPDQPWTKGGFTHELYDHTSILKYLTEKHGLGPLGRRVAAATSIGKELLSKPPDTGELPDHVPMRDPHSPINDIVGDPKTIELDAMQRATINFTLHLEGKSLTPAEVQMMRNSIIRQGPEGHIAVAIDRVREYINKARES